MINTIRVSEKRGLFPERLNLGTIGENNATELVFVLPESLTGYAAELVCETSKGSFVFSLQEYRFALPQELLTDSTLNVQLVLRDNNKVVWKSVPCTFTLNPTLDDSNENLAEQFRNEGREEYRAELADAVQELTGDDVSSDSWDELTSTVTALPLETEDKINARAEYSAWTNAFENATTTISLLTGNYELDYDGDDYQFLKLPYIYTPKAKWTNGSSLSSSIAECGFDVSGATSISTSGKGLFYQKTNLNKLELTGLGHLESFDYLFYNCIGLTELELEFGYDRYGTQNGSWNRTFAGCSNLATIKGELDMSRGSSYMYPFYDCFSLKDVRFKPQTIKHRLDLSPCSMLTAESLLSVLNGVADGTEITILFATAAKVKLSSLRCRISESGLYELSESDTDPTIQSALVSKGVTVS